MQNCAPTDESAMLADLISRALSLADDLGASEVGISLNEALVRLTGKGVPPLG